MAVQIVDFREYKKNTLQGFVTVRLTAVGLEIRDICLHELNGKRWLTMPAKPYEKDGKMTYAFILSFYNRDTASQFNAVTLKALDKYLLETGQSNG